MVPHEWGHVSRQGYIGESQWGHFRGEKSFAAIFCCRFSLAVEPGSLSLLRLMLFVTSLNTAGILFVHDAPKQAKASAGCPVILVFLNFLKMSILLFPGFWCF